MIGKVGSNNLIQQSQFTESEKTTSKEPQPAMPASEQPKFTPAKLAATAEQRFTSSAQGTLIRTALEGKLKVDVPPAAASETATPTQPKEDVGVPGYVLGSPLENIHTVLIRGSKGSDVRTMQTELNNWRIQNGLDPISVTADYNAETEAAVKQFQEANGLKADGKFGPHTRDRLILENDPGFLQLPEETKAKAREVMQHFSPGFGMKEFAEDFQAGRNMVIGLVRSPKFQESSPEVQAGALEEVNVNNPHDEQLTHHIRNYLQLENNPNFKGLDDDTKQDIRKNFEEYYYKQREGLVNMSAQDGLVSLAGDPNFANLSTAHRSEVLDAYKNNPTWNNMTNLTATIETKGFSNADDTMKSRIIGMAKNHGKNDQDMMQLTLLLDSGVFNGMTPEQQNSTLDAYEAMHPNYDADIVK